LSSSSRHHGAGGRGSREIEDAQLENAAHGEHAAVDVVDDVLGGVNAVELVVELLVAASGDGPREFQLAVS